MMTRDNGTYSKSTGPNKEVVLGQLSWGKLVFLCVIALALSFVGPLFVFAPLPLAVAYLLYGLPKTLTISGVMTVATFVASTVSPELVNLSHYSAVMVVSNVIALAVASIIFRAENPVKGLVKRGFIIFGVISVLIGAATALSPLPLKEQVKAVVVSMLDKTKASPEYQEMLKTGGEIARQTEEFVNNPDLLVGIVFETAFAATFVGVFFILWLTLFMLLRNGLIWREVHNYQYQLKDLVRFKAPEFFMYLVVLGFALFIGGEYLGGKSLEIIGANMLYCLGVFYFFQGMGIYLDMLKFLKITGFLRSILTVMTIFLAYRFVAIVGLFDLWVNFRKYFKRKEN